MKLKIITYKLAALLIASLVCFPSQVVESKKGVKHHHHVEYVKPGASVSLLHDYDGKTQKDDLEFFTITLQHLYSDGFVSARLLNTPNLQIHSDTNVNQIRAQEGHILSIPVQFSAAQTGKYYLGVEVIYESLRGDQSVRVLSVPVLVGTQSKAKGETNRSQKTETINEEGFILLPAQEVIQ